MKKVRIGTALAFTALILSFLLSLYLRDGTPFTATAPTAVAGKWLENWQERRTPKTEPQS